MDCGNSEYFVANVDVLGYGYPPATTSIIS